MHYLWSLEQVYYNITYIHTFIVTPNLAFQSQCLLQLLYYNYLWISEKRFGKEAKLNLGQSMGTPLGVWGFQSFADFTSTSGNEEIAKGAPSVY